MVVIAFEPHLEMLPDAQWQNETAAPGALDKQPSAPPVTHCVGNRRDFSFDAAVPFAGSLHVLKLGLIDLASTVRIECQQFASGPIGGFENDLKVPRGGRMYDGSAQYLVSRNVFQIWDTSSGKGKWIDTQVKLSLDPASVMDFAIEYLLLSDRMVYREVSINGETFKLNADFPLLATTWGDNSIVQVQAFAAKAPAKVVRSIFNLSLTALG